jgi:hypothetical protein
MSHDRRANKRNRTTGQFEAEELSPKEALIRKLRVSTIRVAGIPVQTSGARKPKGSERRGEERRGSGVEFERIVEKHSHRQYWDENRQIQIDIWPTTQRQHFIFYAHMKLIGHTVFRWDGRELKAFRVMMKPAKGEHRGDVIPPNADQLRLLESLRDTFLNLLHYRRGLHNETLSHLRLVLQSAPVIEEKNTAW